MIYYHDIIINYLFKLDDIERQKKFQEVCQQAVENYAVNPGGENPPPPPVGGYIKPW